MFRIIGIVIAVGTVLLGAPEAAEAHRVGYHKYDAYGYRYHVVHRNRHMPRWLWRKKGFRYWYYRSRLRFDRHLAWWQLYDAYRFERRHDFRRHYRAHYNARHHDRDWNRRYWHDDDRRGGRNGQRRRHRDDD